jgi:hypothetical protein
VKGSELRGFRCTSGLLDLNPCSMADRNFSTSAGFATVNRSARQTD